MALRRIGIALQANCLIGGHCSVLRQCRGKPLRQGWRGCLYRQKSLIRVWRLSGSIFIRIFPRVPFPAFRIPFLPNQYSRFNSRHFVRLGIHLQDHSLVSISAIYLSPVATGDESSFRVTVFRSFLKYLRWELESLSSPFLSPLCPVTEATIQSHYIC